MQRKTPQTPESKYTLTDLFKLRVENRLSLADMEKVTGIKKATIFYRLKELAKVCPDPDMAHALDSVEPAIVSHVKHRLYASLLDEECLNNSTLNNRAYAFSQIANHERLLKGKSTANISLMSTLVSQSDNALFAKELAGNGTSKHNAS